MRKVLVCGGREYANKGLVDRTLDACRSAAQETGDTMLLIHGGARGADGLAQIWADERGVESKVFPALWDEHGRAAGFIRNQHMIEQRPDLVIAFPGGRGTSDMVTRAVRAGVPVAEVEDETPRPPNSFTDWQDHAMRGPDMKKGPRG